MTVQAIFQRVKGDGHRWHFHKPIDCYVRLAKRGEAYCGVMIREHRQCREPAAIITEIGDCYCDRHFGPRSTDRIRELDEDIKGSEA